MTVEANIVLHQSDNAVLVPPAAVRDGRAVLLDGDTEIAPGVQTFDPNPDGYTLILNDQVRFATGWNARSCRSRCKSPRVWPNPNCRCGCCWGCKRAM